MGGRSPLRLQVALSDHGLAQSLARGITFGFTHQSVHICLHSVRMRSFGILLLMSDAPCHFQEKQQLSYEELIQVIKKERDIYTRLVKSLQDSDR